MGICEIYVHQRHVPHVHPCYSRYLPAEICSCVMVSNQIQDIIVETGQADQKETRSAKDALLLWCQMKTAG